MVEEITTAISRLPWLFVIARNSSFAYKGKSPDLRQVGRELGVRYVLEGSVRKAGNRVRITGQPPATCRAKIQDRRNYSDRPQRVLVACLIQRSQSAHSTIEDPALQC